MKCISVTAKRYFSGTMGPAVLTTRERHAKPEAGIRVDADVRQVNMANGTTVRVSEKFFQAGISASHAVWIGRYLHILRASVVYDDERRDVELTPETDCSDQVLVYLDVSAGDSDRVFYNVCPLAVISHGSLNAFPGQSEEVLLAVMAPDEKIVAIRARRRWVFWGKFQTTETITYSLTGDTMGSFLFRRDPT